MEIFLVSIPFIAGQWSLVDPVLQIVVPGHASQSPSLRGSGRFLAPDPDAPLAAARLNPLHCGAVVASGLQAVLEAGA